MNIIERINQFKKDKLFISQYNQYKELQRKRVKLQLLLKFGYLPSVFLTLLFSVILSMLIIISAFLYIVQSTTPSQFSLFISELIVHPLTILWLLALLCLVPIVSFVLISSAIQFTIEHFYNRKELEQEVKENNAVH